jgi:hypothetical protein
MAIVVGANSWTTISEANAYLTDRIDAANWFLLSDESDPGSESKTSLLVTAFNILYGNQDLNIPISSDDDLVKNAQCEFALFLLLNKEDYFKRIAMTACGIEEFTRSKWSEKLIAVSVPYNIFGMLINYFVGSKFLDLEQYADE